MMDEAPQEMKQHARYMVAKAIKRGELIRGACEKCGRKRRIHAHHPDYTRPLNVQWLCALHHGEAHAGRKVELPEEFTAQCAKCEHKWAIRKKGGGKKCPRCQARRRK